MLKIDENLLKDLGLASLPADEKNQMLAQIYETLEMRVGMTLARQMTDEQLKEFEGFVDGNDEAGALKWLETNFPSYKEVVHSELTKLKEEIKKSATHILSEMEKARGAQPDTPAAEVPPAEHQAQAPPAAHPSPEEQPQPPTHQPE